jgi:hypothetical protein
MYDRSGVRLSVVHVLPSAAEANGLSAGPLLSPWGLGPNAFDDRDQVMRRSRIIARMNGLVRRSGDRQGATFIPVP